MKLVVTVKGRHITIDLDHTDTIATLKQKLELKTGVPTNRQMIIFGGKPLKNENSVESSGLINDATIHLIERNPVTTNNRNRGANNQNTTAAAANNQNTTAAAANNRNTTAAAANNQRGVTNAEQRVKNLAKLFEQEDPNRAANNRRVVTGAEWPVKNLAKLFGNKNLDPQTLMALLDLLEQQGGRKKKKTVAKKKTVTKKKVRKIHKGPRGGKYYISKGRKVYL